jgi:hypothetical protein
VVIIIQMKQLGKTLRYAASLAFCNLYRLLRLFPNNDPIMGFALPFARRDKWWQAMLFPAIAMASFDFITMRVGVWTIGTAVAYALVALLFREYAKRKKSIGLRGYVKGSIAGVLLFDFLTGPIMSSALFRAPFAIAFIGQIPFTAMHLASAVPLTMLTAAAVDPAIRASVCRSTAGHLNKCRLPLAGIPRA